MKVANTPNRSAPKKLNSYAVVPNKDPHMRDVNTNKRDGD